MVFQLWCLACLVTLLIKLKNSVLKFLKEIYYQVVMIMYADLIRYNKCLLMTKSFIFNSLAFNELVQIWIK